MTILSIQETFNQNLAAIYDAEEIKAIFRYYIEIKLNLVDSFLFNDDKIDFNIPTFEDDLNQLKAGKPVQQIVGCAFFYDYFFLVNENTLIPRPETEELIYLITEQFDKNKSLNIIDLGTGSGCIPITLNKLYPNAKVTAIDISTEALKVANRNNEELNTQVNFIQQDLLQDFNLDQKFDIITSNPPYIRELEKEEMHTNVLKFEPHLALFVSNEDPLIFYDRVAKFGLNHLADNGKIYCEINQYLGPETKALFEQYYQNVILHQDISGNDRMIEAFTIK
jgi:release factor glutamine methyltransferase